MSTKNIDDSFKTNGFVEMSYPIDLRTAVEKAIASWQRFCELPIDVKQGLPYSNGADGVGYEFKQGTGPKGDRKENFDVTIAGQQWLDENTKSLDGSGALGFVTDSLNLVTLMKPLILDFARQVESVFNLPGFTQEVEVSEQAFFVRFIHYFGDRESGVETATAHTDQSGFTLHLFESAQGLQCFTFDRKWIDMPVTEGKTVIIPAMQLQLRSKGELKALSHRVIAVPQTAHEGRYSAVCFVQLKDTSKYNKEKWGRLQEMTPGWNYHIPHDEFQKYFK